MADNETRVRIVVEDLASQALATLEGQVGNLGGSFGVVGDKLAQFAGKIGGVPLAIAGGVGAVAAVYEGIKKIAESAIEAGDHIADLSAQTGVAGDVLSAYSQELSNSGTSVDAFAKGMGKLEVALDSARGGSEDSIAAFKRLGVSMEDIKGASPEEVMRKVADAVSATNDPVKTAGALNDVLGKSWKDLVPFLQKGSEGMDEAREKAEALGAVMSEEFVSRADQTADAVDDLSLIFKGFANRIAEQVMPIIYDGAKSLLEWAKNSEVLKIAADVLAGVFKTIVSAVAIVIGVVDAAGTSISTLAKAFMQAAEGDFSGAWDTIKGGAVNVGDTIKATSEKIEGIWDGTVGKFETGSEKSKNAFAGIGDAAAKTKPEIDKVAQATDAFIAKLNDQADALEKQASTGEKATAADKAMEQALVALRDGKIKDTQATRDAIDAAVERIRKADDEIDRAKRLADLELELAKGRDAAAAAMRKQTEDADAALAKATDELNSIGKTKEELKEMAAARYDATAATLEQKAAILANAGVLDDEYDTLMRNAQTWRDAGDAVRASGYKEAALDAAKESEKAFDETSKTIEKSLTDSLMRSFEGGKDFASSFIDGLKNLFKTLVLRPVIQAIVQPVAAGVTGMLGFSGTANAAGSGGNLLSTASSWLSSSSMLSSANSLLAGTGMMSGLTNASASALGYGTLAYGAGLGEMGGGMAAFQAMDMAGMGASFSGAGSAMGTIAAAAPYIAAAVAAAYVLSQVLGGGDTRYGSAYGYSRAGGATAGMTNIAAHANAGGITYLNPNAVTRLAGPGDGSINGSAGEAATVQAVASTITSINTLLQGLGSSSRVDQFWGKVESSEADRGGVLAGGILSTGQQFGFGNMLGNNYSGNQFDPRFTFSPSNEQALKNFAVELQDTTVSALKAATDIPASVRKILDSTTDSATAITQIGTLIGSVQALAKNFVDIGGAFRQLSTISFDARSSILALTGGLDAFSSKAAAYVQNYYTEDERAMITAASVFRTLSAAGVDTNPLASKGIYRSEMDAQDLSTEAGRKRFSALLNESTAFASLSDFMEASGMTLESMAARAPGGNTLDMLRSSADLTETTAAATTETAAGIQTLVDLSSAAYSQMNDTLTSIDNRLATIESNGALASSQPVYAPYPDYSNGVG